MSVFKATMRIGLRWGGNDSHKPGLFFLSQNTLLDIVSFGEELHFFHGILCRSFVDRLLISLLKVF